MEGGLEEWGRGIGVSGGEDPENSTGRGRSGGEGSCWGCSEGMWKARRCLLRVSGAGLEGRVLEESLGDSEGKSDSRSVLPARGRENTHGW